MLAYSQVVDLWTVVPATDPEIATSSMSLATGPLGLGSATSTIHQGSWEEPHLPVTQVTTGSSSSVPDVYPKAVQGLNPALLLTSYGNSPNVYQQMNG